jgi:hypothetical protein
LLKKAGNEFVQTNKSGTYKECIAFFVFDVSELRNRGFFTNDFFPYFTYILKFAVLIAYGLFSFISAVNPVNNLGKNLSKGK